jgi:PAS domain S-box-containing protein
MKEAIIERAKKHTAIDHKFTGDNLKRLENAHQELMVFFNAMDEVFFSVDAVNFKTIQISKGCEQLYGYSMGDFLANSRLWFELIHPDDKHIVDNKSEMLQSGRQVNHQYRIIRKDNSVRWVENKAIPTLDRTGKLIRIDGITRDITARKEAEEEQRQRDERYRQIVETAQEGIWTIDEKEKTNFVNNKICEILGYSSDEMLGKELYDFMDDAGKAYAIDCMERRRRGVKENLDIRYVTKTGKDIWTNISANPIFDKTGRYKGSLAMVTDITQRKLDEEALKKSEANLRTVFENTDTSYVLIDDEMRIISFNALAQKFSEEQNGIPLKVNDSMRNYFSDERWVFVKKTLDKVKRTGIAEYELSYMHADGSSKWYHVRWLIVKNSDNKNCGFILANKEITEAKIAALERERITSDLIQHNKDLEQFTYIISHNLRAPVANIIGLSAMLKENEFEPAEKQEVFNRVSKSIENIDVVIRDLNHILQAREPGNEKKETVCFHELVDSIRTSISETVLKENVQFKCCFDEAGGIFTVRSYLYSIFYNLSLNSIKFHRPGIDPVIEIRSIALKDKIELRFKDNGKGIDLDKNASHLFGLYKRFDTTVEGKGMGLFMVKTQVETLGGTIKIKSKLNEGTEFIIQLPI